MFRTCAMRMVTGHILKLVGGLAKILFGIELAKQVPRGLVEMGVCLDSAVLEASGATHRQKQSPGTAGS